MDENLETHEAGGEDAAEKTAPRPTSVDRLRALHDAIMLSPGNIQAVVALGAVAMAEAQGRIERGPHARRQTLLAMAQGLHSAGYRPALATVGLLFSELRQVGLFKVERSSDSHKGMICHVEMVRPKKSTRRADVDETFTLAWGAHDVEQHPVLRVAQTPCEGLRVTGEPPPGAYAQMSPELACAHEERDEEIALAAEASAALKSMQTPRAPAMRSFWAQEGGDAY